MTGTYISCLMTIFAHHYWALVDQALVTFPVRDVKSSSLQFKAASHCSLFVSLEWLRKKSVDSWAHFKQEALVKILFFVVLAIHWSYNCWSSVLLVIYNTKSNPTGMLISTHSAAKNTHMIYPVEPHTISSVMM